MSEHGYSHSLHHGILTLTLVPSPLQRKQALQQLRDRYQELAKLMQLVVCAYGCLPAVLCACPLQTSSRTSHCRTTGI